MGINRSGFFVNVTFSYVYLDNINTLHHYNYILLLYKKIPIQNSSDFGFTIFCRLILKHFTTMHLENEPNLCILNSGDNYK